MSWLRAPVLAVAVGCLLIVAAWPASASQQVVMVTLAVSPTTATSGQGVTLATAVTGRTPAAGTVQWYYSTNAGASYRRWSGHDSTLSGGNASTTWVTNSPTSKWRWRARYAGDATHSPAWSASVGVAVRSPDLSIRYARASSAQWFTGLAFDACSAPSLAQMQAWRSSPYRAVAVYLSGSQRFCKQPNLTKDWVTAVTVQGWKLLPVHLGQQPYCTGSKKTGRYTYSTSHDVGISEAKEAVAAARALGMVSGSVIYTDVEHYDPHDATCRAAVVRNLSAWTAELHRQGWLAGAYLHRVSGIPHLSASYSSTSYAGPDAVWMAKWDGVASTTAWPELPASQWAVHQRAKQYRGGHDEMWGAVRMNVDSDVVDGPVAVVPRRYSVTVAPVTARRGPSTAAAAVRTWPAGAVLPVVCQGAGSPMGTTSVWDLLADGTWVSDYRMSTASKTTFSSALPRCSWPGSVTAADGLNARKGPGGTYPTRGSRLPYEALAWVTCQRSGSKVGTSWVWDRLADGRYVSDYYVRNRSNTTYSSPVPHC